MRSLEVMCVAVTRWQRLLSLDNKTTWDWLPGTDWLHHVCNRSSVKDRVQEKKVGGGGGEALQLRLRVTPGLFF